MSKDKQQVEQKIDQCRGLYKEYRKHMVRGFKDLRQFDDNKELTELLKPSS